MEAISFIAEDPEVVRLARALGEGSRVVATGACGSAPSFVAAAVHRLASRPVIVVVAHLDDADEMVEELAGMGVSAARVPALEVLPGETNVSLELFAERLGVVRRVSTGDVPGVLVCPIQALMQLVPGPGAIAGLVRSVRVGERVELGGLLAWLNHAGYTRVEAIEEAGEFAVRGGIVDIFPPGGGGGVAPERNGLPLADPGMPVRLEFFGDELERIAEVDIETMGSDRSVSGVELLAAKAELASDEKTSVNFLELLPRESVAMLVETLEVVEQGRGYFERAVSGVGLSGPPAVLKILESRFRGLAEFNQFSAGASSVDTRIELGGGVCPTFDKDAENAVRELAGLAGEARVVVACQNEGERQRFGELIRELAPEHQARVASVGAYVHRGFAWARGNERLLLVPYHELLNRFTVRRRATRLRAGRAMDTFLDFQVGDYVVHQDHGIALFSGLTLMKPREVPAAFAANARKREPEQEEYLTLEFAGRSRLHVPAAQIDKVQKYIGGFSGKPPLSTLGGQKWKNQKERTAESVKDLAAEMLRVRAAREHVPGVQFPGDTPWQKEFEAEFPYTETEDQLAAIAEIKRDMHSARPMDRLVCGDVGFGKTELAIRAAFKCCEFGKQAAVLVPTTVLAEQHERTFRSRFAGYPFRVESLSRFKSGKESNEILAALRKGHVDVIIGTHRLLSQDVRFADLALVIVDEEQRFGVEHKEQLLRLRLTVDVLTLSATPIPRTLHMAMLGLRDISSLTTAPLDRRAIVTEVIPYNERRIQQAIARELSRDGQVFFVHNRVYDIKSVADEVQRLVPEARIVVGHGQMPPHELEEVMLKFMRREADVLVSTTIIESGIDIASANTMIVNRADAFGLADLHQLRGRVGRSKHRAYCYLLLPPDKTVKEIAQKRLKAIEQYSMLGAGFKIAMRDLEIRGAGNILGAEQSGHIAAVGYEMYCHLLENAVRELKSEPAPKTAGSVSVEIGVSGVIPRGYVPSDPRRLEAYRRLATATTAEQLERCRTDLGAAYGEPPRPTQRLFDLAELRIALSGLGVSTVTIREKDAVFLARDPEPLARALRESKAATALRVSVLPPPKDGGADSEVYLRLPDNYQEPETLLRVLRHRLCGTSENPESDTPAPARAPVPRRP